MKKVTKVLALGITFILFICAVHLISGDLNNQALRTNPEVAAHVGDPIPPPPFD